MSLVTYSYPQNLFVNSTYLGNPYFVDYADIDYKLKALIFSSGTYMCIGNISNTDNTTTYLFTYDKELNIADKNTLDSFIANYSYIPMLEIMCTARETKSTNINAGTFFNGQWVVRNLNELVGNMRFATLANSQITVNPGLYIISAKATSCNVGANRIRIKNITDNTYFYGQNATSNSLIDNSIANVSNSFYCMVPTTFQIEHKCTLISLNIGLGKASGVEPKEIYTTVSIQQISSF